LLAFNLDSSAYELFLLSMLSFLRHPRGSYSSFQSISFSRQQSHVYCSPLLDMMARKSWKSGREKNTRKFTDIDIERTKRWRWNDRHMQLKGE